MWLCFPKEDLVQELAPSVLFLIWLYNAFIHYSTPNNLQRNKFKNNNFKFLILASQVLERDHESNIHLHECSSEYKFMYQVKVENILEIWAWCSKVASFVSKMEFLFLFIHSRKLSTVHRSIESGLYTHIIALRVHHCSLPRCLPKSASLTS